MCNLFIEILIYALLVIFYIFYLNFNSFNEKIYEMEILIVKVKSSFKMSLIFFSMEDSSTVQDKYPAGCCKS